ncbi:MAG TPA: pseudouridine synthase [Bacteroidota bacterium]|nr:pseudouridine synthase [Bacteroidota bacterium]
MNEDRSYILFYKPYGVLCQFTDESGKQTLRDFGPFPKGVYGAGRLDFDSEGLLLLTDNPRVSHRLTDPRFGHPRTYLVQVEGIPTKTELKGLRDGVGVQGKVTRRAEVKLVGEPLEIPPRVPPIRVRKTIPTSWIEITLREGRNRQVRHMTAAVGHPTLRLIRVGIGDLDLSGLAPGKSRKLTSQEIEALKQGLGL